MRMEEKMPVMYMLVGLSASGKSSIRDQIAAEADARILSTDDLRKKLCPGGVPDQSMNSEIFRIFHESARELLLAGKNVIMDATSLNMKDRAGILRICPRGCRKVALVFTKPEYACAADDVDREYPVGADVICRQMSKFQIPFREEGFHEIRLIPWDPALSQDPEKVADRTGIHYFTPAYARGQVSFEELKARMDAWDQKNPFHALTLGGHCDAAASLFEGYGYGRPWEIAAQIHDIGKLFTQSFDANGVAHYYMHENVGAHYVLTHRAMVEEAFGPLTDEEFLDLVFLINYHMMPMSWVQQSTVNKKRQVFGDQKLQLLLDFNACDKGGK